MSNSHKHFCKNEDGRDFVVGDLHGCIKLLDEALAELEFDKEIDRMFSVGDLIDRGPESMACLRLLKEPWFFPVIGNHEEFLIRSIIDGEDPKLWFQNGGSWVLEEGHDEVAELANFIKGNIPYAMTIETAHGKIGICHAQSPTNDWKDAIGGGERAIECMLWARTKIQHKDHSAIEGVFKTIHGHTIIAKPCQLGNSIFIDTGAFHTGDLTTISIGGDDAKD